jgi:outer membrane protein
MKKLSLIIIASVFLGLAGQKLNAQELKFGHIDSGELIQALPEFDTAIARLERFSRELSNTLEIMQVELNNKFVTYEREASNLLDIVKQSREQELNDLSRRIQEFQQTAQQQLNERQSEYFQPIMAKVEKTIQDVGRENGFIYIFIVGGQVEAIGYFDETKSIDVMPLAKAKLGIR